jgi:alkylglycerol monooxygenase
MRLRGFFFVKKLRPREQPSVSHFSFQKQNTPRMEVYGAILNRVIPIFFLLFFVELYVDWRRGTRAIRGLDSVSSFSSGMTNVIKDVLGLTISLLSYEWLLRHVALTSTPAAWWTYAVAFVVVDFKGYWVHRWSHEINFLWNRHIIHHSSEEFNLSCALRQSVSELINYFTILLLPAALLGVPLEVVAVIGPLHLFLQYWYHTRLIGTLWGWVEYALVTPAHHRVHHAINREYMDKNYGQIFILWDRWFGTFQAERPDVPPVYGVTRPVRTWNPLKINFLHAWRLLLDAWHTARWRDKLRIWFMPTGWRPADVAARFPIASIGDPYNFEKYDTPHASRWFVTWAWVQLFFCYFLLVYFLGHIAAIGTPGMFAYGGFMALCVFAYTELMDGHRYAPWLETAKSALGLWLIVRSGGDWFGAATQVGAWYVWVVATYLLLSAGMAWYVGMSMELANRSTEEGF